MRNKLMLLAALLSLHSPALAQSVIPSNTVSIGIAGSTNKTIEFNKAKAGTSSNPKIRFNNSTTKLQYTNDGTNYSDIGSGGGANNILPNGSFESGTTDWTASGGTLSTSTTAADVFELTTAGTWDSNSAGQTLTYTPQAVKGLAGTNGELTCMVRVPSGTATHTMGIWDGTTLSQTQTLVNSSGNTNYVANTINFIFPSSGSIGVRFTSVNSNEPLIDIDACFIGPPRNLSQVSQATLVGGAVITGCAGAHSTSSTSITSLGTQTSCSYAVFGEALAPSTNLMALRFASLPPGEYFAVYDGLVGSSVSAKGANFQFYDGTSAFRETSQFVDGGSNARGPHISNSISYTTSKSNVTIEIRASAESGGTAVIYGTTSNPGTIKLYRFPNSSQLAVTPIQQNYDWTPYTPTFTGFGSATVANSGDCKHKREGSDLLLDCKFTSGSSTATEARISLPSGLTSASGTKLASIKVAGEMHVTSSTIQLVALSEPAVTYLTFGYQDGTTNPLTKVNGNAVFSNGVVYHFNARLPIEGWIQTNAAPLLVGSVISGTSGVERHERAVIADGANCTASPCTISYQSGSWLSSVTRTSQGLYVANFTAGAFSGPVSCTGVSRRIGTGGTFVSPTASASSSSFSFDTRDPADTVQDSGNIHLQCTGPR